MATDRHMRPAELAPAEVCRARAAEARTFALASAGNDVAVWLEVARNWEELARIGDAFGFVPQRSILWLERAAASALFLLA